MSKSESPIEGAKGGIGNPDAASENVAVGRAAADLLLVNTLASLHRMLEDKFSRDQHQANSSHERPEKVPASSSVRLRPPTAYSAQMKFDLWEAQFLAYVDANQVAPEQRTAVLLSLLAPECQEFFLNNELGRMPCQEALQVLRKRYTDANLREKNYMELVAAEQSSSESISDFYDRLVSYARLAGMSSDAEPLLKARFCHGLRDKALAEKLMIWSQEAAGGASSADLAQKAKEMMGVHQLLRAPTGMAANVRSVDREKGALEARVEELEKLVKQQAEALMQRGHQPTPFPAKQSHTNQPHRQRTNLGQKDQSEGQQAYHHGKKPFTSRPPRACHRCGSLDHLIADCPTPPPAVSKRPGVKKGPVQNPATSEIGTITTWHHSYGFIQSEQLPEKLFCHRGQLAPSLSRLVDQHQIVGTRVLFQRQVDPGRDHDQACSVKLCSGPGRAHCGQASAAEQTQFESSYFVQLLLGDCTVMSCLDSGANASVMGRGVMERLVAADPINHVFTPGQKSAKATAFNGSTTEILGSLRCEVELGKLKKAHVFLVTADSTAEALLGIDFLRSFQVLLDFTEGRALVAGEAVPVIEGDRGVFRLRRVQAACAVELPPRSETLIPSRVLNPIPHSQGIVAPKLFSSDSECFVARSIDSVSPTNHVLVRLLNSSDKPAQIERGQEIASFQELSRGEVVAQTDLTERDFSLDNCNSLNGKIARLPAPDKGISGWLIKQFRLDETKLTPNQLSLTLRVLNYFMSQISQNDTDLGHTNLHEMTIELASKDTRPVALPSRRTTPAQKEFLDAHISQMLEQGVIEESNSDWASPIVLVKKKDGTQRLCIDYRAVNKLIKPCSFPLPLIEESFDSLSGSTVFSSLDLTSAYWQVGIREEDRDITAFTCPQGTYRWTVVPFGIKTAPANFSKLMHRVFRPLLMRVTLIYLDDIIIKAIDNNQMVTNLALVLWQLRKANLKIKPAKCELFREKVKFLGFVVSASGIEADPAKTQAVQEWPTPADKKQLLSFLGFANYYRKFVPRFSVIATPLYAIAKGSEKFRWLACHDRAFQELKRSLCSPPVLAYPDMSGHGGEFVLDCDSSLEGVGAVLSQTDRDGTEQVVAYASKKFNASQTNYCATMRELLGLVLMLEHFRPYLLDKPFTVRVDAAALQWLHSKKHATGMLAQWLATIELYEFKVQQSTLERLAEYDFTVQYRPGPDHVNADVLSRNPRFRSDHFDCPTCSQIPEFQEKFQAKCKAKSGIKISHVAVQCSSADAACQIETLEDENPSTESSCQTDASEASEIPVIAVAVSCQTDFADLGHRQVASTVAVCQTETANAVQNPAIHVLVATTTACQTDLINTEEVNPPTEVDQGQNLNLPGTEWAREAQETCVDLTRLMDSVQGRAEKLTKKELQSCSREVRTLWSLFEQLTVENGILFRIKPEKKSKSTTKLLVIPESADIGGLVTQYHSALNHCGIAKTSAAIKARFSIADLDVCVKCVIAECQVCAQKKKTKQKNKAPLQPELAGYPNQVVHLDHAGPFPEQSGFRYLLVMVDRFSGYVEIAPVSDVTAETTATTLLTEWIARYGAVEQVVSDNGTAFINSVMRELTRLLEVDMTRVTARRPQANGKAERMIQTVKSQIRAICLERQFDWPLAARLAALSIRATVAESTGFSPAKLFFGRELSLPLDLVHNPPKHDYYRPEAYAHYLHKTLVEVSASARQIRGRAQERQKRYYDRNALYSNFQVGELVWVLNPNHRGLDPAVWLGPYKVVQKISERTYRLVPEFSQINSAQRVPNPSHNIYNIDRLKRCIRQPTYQDIIDRYGVQPAARIPSSRLGSVEAESSWQSVSESPVANDANQSESSVSQSLDISQTTVQQNAPSLASAPATEVSVSTPAGESGEEAGGLKHEVSMAEPTENAAIDQAEAISETGAAANHEQNDPIAAIEKVPEGPEQQRTTVDGTARPEIAETASMQSQPITTRAGRTVRRPARFRALVERWFPSM